MCTYKCITTCPYLMFSRGRNHQEHQRAVSCTCGATEKPAAQHRPQRAHLLHPRHPSAVGEGPPADRWENWGRWSGFSPPGAPPDHYCLAWYSWVHMSVQRASLLWSWWPVGCHQRLNMKNPSNGLNGVHQRPALPSDLACWLTLNTSVVSLALPFLCSRAQELEAIATLVWIPTTKDQLLLLNSKDRFLPSTRHIWFHF